MPPRVATARVPRRPRSERAERTRLRILEAGAEHFAERGFEGARLEDIAAQVGLSGPALLYHFRDKRSLYGAVLAMVFEGMLDRVGRALEAPAPFPQRLAEAAREWLDFVAARPSAAQILLRESASLSLELREDVAALTAPLLDLLERVFEEGRREGHFRDPIEPVHFAMAVAGTTVLFAAAVPRMGPGVDFDPRDPEQRRSHEREVLRIAWRLLGMAEPEEER